VGEDMLGVTDELMKTLNQSSVNNAISNLAAVKSQYEAIEAARKTAEEKLANATNDKDKKFWEEELTRLTGES
jgi:hypothetical protein